MVIFTSTEFTVAASIMALTTFMIWVQIGLSGSFNQLEKAIFIVCNGITLLLISLSMNLANSTLEYAANIPSLVVAVFGLIVQANSKLSNQVPAIRVGDTIPFFSGLDENGVERSILEMLGKPFVIKFFRGHWCPFCIGELRQWEEHEAELNEIGVKNLLFISQDTPTQIREGKKHHKLNALQLSDKDLKITDLFNLRNYKLDATSIGQKNKSFAKPTTILVDGQGIVSWIGQAEDLQIRTELNELLSAAKHVAFKEKAGVIPA